MGKDGKRKRLFLLLSVLFLLASGVWYSRAFYSGELEMGEPTSIDGVEEMKNMEREVRPAGIVEKLNLNETSKEELQFLPGIGEGLAEAIVLYREEHGEFQAISEIMEVSGIGEKKFGEIQEYITVE